MSSTAYHAFGPREQEPIPAPPSPPSEFENRTPDSSGGIRLQSQIGNAAIASALPPSPPQTSRGPLLLQSMYGNSAIARTAQASPPSSAPTGPLTQNHAPLEYSRSSEEPHAAAPFTSASAASTETTAVPDQDRSAAAARTKPKETEQSTEIAGSMTAPGENGARAETGGKAAKSKKATKSQKGSAREAATRGGGPAAGPKSGESASAPEGGAAASDNAMGGAGGAAPQLDTSSSEGVLQSLSSSPPSSFPQALGAARAATPGIQSQEKSDLAESFPEVERPSGLPRGGGAPKAAPTAKGATAPPESPAAGGREGEAPETKAEVAAGPVPASQVSAAVAEPAQQEESSWWSWLVDRVRNFLSTIPASDPGLSTSAGDRPQVDLTGDADPALNERQQQSSDESVSADHAQSDVATNADFGENNIYPAVPVETLRSSYRTSAPPAAGGAAGRTAPAIPGDAREAFDSGAASWVDQPVSEQLAQYREQQASYEQRTEEVQEEGQRRIDEETESVRAEQEGLQQQARGEVDARRAQWRDENAQIQETFSKESRAKRQAVDQQIQTQTQTAEKQADHELTSAEQKAEQERVKAEAKAVEEKRQAESKPRSWWDSVKGAVSDVFAAIKSAVNFIFDALRKAVKVIIEAAKVLVRGIIEAARLAIVGFIKLFGEAIKGLVTIALIAFPDAAARARAWIDDKVNTAVDAVNEAAEALKAAADAILDWIGETIDAALSLLQKVFLAALDALEWLANKALEAMELLAEVTAWLATHSLFLEGLERLWNSASEIEAEAHKTLEGLISQIPGKASELVEDAKKYFTEGVVKHIKGIWRHLEPALIHLKDHWWEELKQMVWNLVWPFNEKSPLWKDVPELVHLPGKIFTSIGNGEISTAIDQFLELVQKINSILGIFYGWFFIASVLVGTIIGAFFGGAGAIPGAIAGAEFAGAVGEGLLIAMVATESAVIVKGAADLMLGTGDAEQAYGRIANSTLTLAITAVMVILGEIAADLAKAIVEGVRGFFKGEVPEAPVRVEADTAPPETKAGGEPGEPAAGGEPPETAPEGEAPKTAEGETIVAEEPTADGQHKIEVTEEGKCLICSDCAELRAEYKTELEDPANAGLKGELDAADAITDPDLKAQKEVEIEQKLAEVRRTRELSTERGKTTPKTRSEAESILQAEQEGLVKGEARRPDPDMGEADHDFILEDEHGKPLNYADIKTPVDPTFRSIPQQAADIAGHIKGYSPDVDVVIDLKNLKPAEKAQFQTELQNNGVSPGRVKIING